MNIPAKNNIDPKILIGIVTVLIAAAIIIGTFTLKRNPGVQPHPSPTPETTPTNRPRTTQTTLPTRPQIGTKEGSASASKESSNQVPLAKRYSAKFIDGVIVSFDSSTKILTISTKDQPALQITIGSSVKLYKDRGMADIVPIQPSELTKGSTVSVQEDTVGKIIQITVAYKP